MSEESSFLVEFYYEKDLGNGWEHAIALHEVIIRKDTMANASAWAESACHVVAAECHHPLNKENDGEDDLTADEVCFKVTRLPAWIKRLRKEGEVMDKKVLKTIKLII